MPKMKMQQWRKQAYCGCRVAQKDHSGQWRSWNLNIFLLFLFFLLFFFSGAWRSRQEGWKVMDWGWRVRVAVGGKGVGGELAVARERGGWGVRGESLLSREGEREKEGERERGVTVPRSQWLVKWLVKTTTTCNVGVVQLYVVCSQRQSKAGQETLNHDDNSYDKRITGQFINGL